jgi:ribosomal-protein-alanine N-acetyltransferase
MKINVTAQDLVRFEQEAQACHWTEAQFLDSLNAENALLLTHTKERQFAGYLLCQCVLDECELLQISIHPLYKRQGIGLSLIEQLTQQLAASGCKRLLLEVRENNKAAIALYQKTGFCVDGVRKGYYPLESGIKENAVLMSLSL